ncbi:hypothetical protein [Leisingera methylohalidivorans]|uniref:Uncharacterized protein n=1 Tax=Leisingera methylohalidivorans DSM 14336 TaxID=999552 RepID=V9W1B0_9RHOB|nr:hypothetical protein [Leisingera methylohalidivorans]AHD02957.1 hypothetical protein METH_06940 [Leisingera methylohalidivorans DSM 14336]
MAALSALCELTGSETSQSQRTAGTADGAAAYYLGWLLQTAEFAKSAFCASQSPVESATSNKATPPWRALASGKLTKEFRTGSILDTATRVDDHATL